MDRKRECKWGDSCRFFKQNRCKFKHSNSSTHHQVQAKPISQRSHPSKSQEPSILVILRVSDPPEIDIYYEKILNMHNQDPSIKARRLISLDFEVIPAIEALRSGLYSTVIVSSLSNCCFEDSRWLDELKEFVALGGVLIFAGAGNGLACDIISRLFGKTWKFSDYFRTNFEKMGHFFSPLLENSSSKISVKACIASGVPEHERVYATTSNSKHESLSMILSSQDEDVEQNLTAVALGNFGAGYVAYLGDVNAEHCTLRLIKVMYKSLSKQAGVETKGSGAMYSLAGRISKEECNPPAQEEKKTQCSLPSCIQPASKRCGRCKVAIYCCREHQSKHWKTHKIECFSTQQTDAPNSTSRNEAKKKVPNAGNNPEISSEKVANNATSSRNNAPFSSRLDVAYVKLSNTSQELGFVVVWTSEESLIYGKDIHDPSTSCKYIVIQEFSKGQIEHIVKLSPQLDIGFVCESLCNSILDYWKDNLPKFIDERKEAGMPRVDVYYGRTDNTTGYKTYGCIVVQTSDTELNYYDDVYEPRNCEYRILFEMDSADVTKWFDKKPSSRGFVDNPLKSQVLNHWIENTRMRI